MSFGIAVYQCCRCKHTWSAQPGPVNDGCPRCQNVYMTWVNFEWWQKQYEMFLKGVAK